MPEQSQPLIFDGHNDALLKLAVSGGLAAAPGFLTGRKGDIDIPRARAGGFAGGFFALYVRSPTSIYDKEDAMAKPSYDLPLSETVSQETALPDVMKEAAILLRLQELGAVRICRTAADIRAAMQQNVMAAVLHMEGCEAIDPDLEALEVFYAAGLRSLGPVWSRPTVFGHGVPFRFPSDGNIGPGLTEAGKRLVKRCNELGVMIDLSHLNEAGFWDVARQSDAPLVATHSNAHAICPHARNLTDRQLAAIAESDGMVGLNFAVAFLREDGQMRADVPMTTLLRHMDHIMEIVGENRLGIGSDFDGAMCPETIRDVAGLPVLRKAMRDHGYGEDLITRICHGNWLRVLEKTWGA